MPGGLFALKVIPAFFSFAFEITISRLQTWSDMVRCSSMQSDAVISHTRNQAQFKLRSSVPLLMPTLLWLILRLYQTLAFTTFVCSGKFVHH